MGETGMLSDTDFGEIKRAFRQHIDTRYDHSLLLNEKDPWSGPLVVGADHDLISLDATTGRLDSLPGLSLFDGDPTTENIARWIAEWCRDTWASRFTGCAAHVAETAVNAATYELNWPVARFNALAKEPK
jgi:6-pyruvoyl-tetrahydropterin synthase